MAARGVHNSAISWTPHYRLAWGGTLGTQGEVWTNALKFCPLDNSQLTLDMFNTARVPVWSALTDWMKTGVMSGQATMTWMKLNQVLATGLQNPGATNVYSPAPVTPTVAGTNVPLYQTQAISLRGATARGRGHIGRIFPPCVSFPLDVNGRLSAALAGSMATQFGTLLQALQLALRAATSTVGGFAVMSPGNTAKSTVPTYQLITKIEVDTVPDVQHRRTNKLARIVGTPVVVSG